jgi:ribosomal protein S27AE
MGTKTKTLDQLNDDITIKAAEFLKKKERALGPCGRCGGTDWNATSLRLLGTLVSETQNTSEPTKNVPMLLLACTNCGLTYMHNLIVLGLEK